MTKFVNALSSFAVLCTVSGIASAQAPSNPISTGEKNLYSFISASVVAGAQKMPEENYAFKPTPDIRSFGQLVGHLADAQYMFCAMALGEKPPVSGIEKGKTSKADLVDALKGAVDYCTKVYGGMTDDKAAQITKMMGRDAPRATVLTLNTAHTDEHYGNMVTYLRLKNIVPPTSEPAPNR